MLKNKNRADASMEGDDINDEIDAQWQQTMERFYLPNSTGGVSGKSLNLGYFKSLKIPGLNEVDICVKKVGTDEITGYLTLWGNPDIPDLESEYFTKETDFWDDALGKSAKPLTWNHAQDRNFKADVRVGQIVEWGDDDIGRWYIATLDRSHKYRKAIEKLINDGKLGTSSDSAPQYVERIQTGKSVWLKSWPLFAASLTDTPAEPRMVGSVDYLKSLGIQVPDSSKLGWKWNSSRIRRLKN